ncbi:hypothetical protein [Ruegeria lacuscaerulensis]|uniref:hypothetical protein n=1 Tax=Ruegeria lacuscaerulensis TaxID=55218 RepID=UPI001479ADFF|nr:hypothetical protein [Ruegeria lacuscaerulensis]
MSKVSGVAGAVRIQRLSAVGLAAAEAHGKRLDHNGRARAVSDDPALTTTGLDLRELHAAHVANAHQRKGAPEALHVVVQFPTQLVNGDAGKAMLMHARAFAQSIFGDAAIFADRVDRDEKSRHVVDLFLAPRYEKKTKRGSKLAISTSKHLKDLAAQRSKAPTLRGQGQALQDALFEYLRNEAKLDVKRGSKKMRPGEDWLTPEQLELNRLEAAQKLAERNLEALHTRQQAAAKSASAHEKYASDVQQWAKQKIAEIQKVHEDAEAKRQEAERYLEANRNETLDKLGSLEDAHKALIRQHSKASKELNRLQQKYEPENTPDGRFDRGSSFDR